MPDEKRDCHELHGVPDDKAVGPTLLTRDVLAAMRDVDLSKKFIDDPDWTTERTLALLAAAERAERLEVENRVLAAALEPFAEWVEGNELMFPVWGWVDGTHLISQLQHGSGPKCPTLGHCRAAQQVLARRAGKGDGT